MSLVRLSLIASTRRPSKQNTLRLQHFKIQGPNSKAMNVNNVRTWEMLKATYSIIGTYLGNSP